MTEDSMTLAEKALAAKRGKTNDRMIQEAELAVLFVNGAVNARQVQSVLGMNGSGNAYSRSFTILRTAVAAGLVSVRIVDRVAESGTESSPSTTRSRSNKKRVKK